MEPFIIWEEGIPVHIVLLLCVRVCVGGGGGGGGGGGRRLASMLLPEVSTWHTVMMCP